MTDSWVGLFELVLTLILLAGLLTSVSAMSTASNKVMTALEDENTMRESLQEYRKYNAFDNKTVSGANVISTVLLEEGSSVGIAVRIKATGVTHEYFYRLTGGNLVTITSASTVPTTLQSLIRLNSSYRGTLNYTANGNVGVIHFEEL